MEKAESRLRRRIVKALRERGYYAETQHGSVYSGRGRSDITVGCPYLVKIEVKTRRGKLTRQQLSHLEDVRRADCVAFVARSIEDAVRGVELAEEGRFPYMSTSDPAEIDLSFLDELEAEFSAKTPAQQEQPIAEEPEAEPEAIMVEPVPEPYEPAADEPTDEEPEPDEPTAGTIETPPVDAGWADHTTEQADAVEAAAKKEEEDAARAAAITAARAAAFADHVVDREEVVEAAAKAIAARKEAQALIDQRETPAPSGYDTRIHSIQQAPVGGLFEQLLAELRVLNINLQTLSKVLAGPQWPTSPPSPSKVKGMLETAGMLYNTEPPPPSSQARVQEMMAEQTTKVRRKRRSKAEMEAARAAGRS